MTFLPSKHTMAESNSKGGSISIRNHNLPNFKKKKKNAVSKVPEGFVPFNGITLHFQWAMQSNSNVFETISIPKRSMGIWIQQCV